ncbi:hypothetical protein [Terasakiella pusilla]|uniref:hypothetical protein n=1 Tax=Terasakiella pusilla TaxID=64973 RepID=UPI00048E99BF|nr:hypothetical protein [Terasakiella pusilla]
MLCNQAARITIDPTRHHHDVLKSLHTDYMLKERVTIMDKDSIATLDGQWYLKGRKSIITDGIGTPLDRDAIRDEIDMLGDCTVYIWSYPIYRQK